jgi:hypothetical protein
MGLAAHDQIFLWSEECCLRTAVAPESAPVTVEALRQVLREELRSR